MSCRLRNYALVSWLLPAASPKRVRLRFEWLKRRSSRRRGRICVRGLNARRIFSGSRSAAKIKKRVCGRSSKNVNRSSKADEKGTEHKKHKRHKKDCAIPLGPLVLLVFRSLR